MKHNSAKLELRSRVLFRVWLGAIAATVLLELIWLAIPNEWLHFGRKTVLTYGVTLLLIVATVTLPLLVLAAASDRRARRLRRSSDASDGVVKEHQRGRA